MAENSLHKRGDTFNQSSPSSHSAFQLSERIADLELSGLLLAQAEAMLAVSLQNALSELSHYQRHHFLAAVHELITAIVARNDAVLSALRPEKTG